MSRLGQLIRYMSNVFHVHDLVKGVSDSRDKSRVRIATSAVLLAWIVGFCVRIRSREEMGRLLDRRGVQKLIGGHISADTLGRVLGQINSDSLRQALLVPLVRDIRRNKAWTGGSIHGQILVGLDGSEAFCTQKQPCPDCSSRQLEVKVDGKLTNITEYYHRAVCAYIIGTRPRIYLDIEPIKSGEGEVTAAIRLVTRLAENYGRWIDGIVADHGFAGAPFLNHVRRNGLHYVVRVKDEERRYLTKAAAEYCTQRKAYATWTERVGHRNLQVAVWDKDGFTDWKGLAEPARVVVCDETELAQAPNRRRRIAEAERIRPRAFYATSYPSSKFPTYAVWLAYHRRWDIENSGFRQLKHEWHWDHAFVHTADALLNLWLLMVAAANLFEVFVSRRLSTTRTEEAPVRTVAEELAALLRTLTDADIRSWSSG